MPEGTIFRVRISGPLERVREFLRRHPMESQRVQVEGGFVRRLDLFVDARQRQALIELGLPIEREFDASANLLARQAEVDAAARLAPKELPPPVGRLVD